MAIEFRITRGARAGARERFEKSVITIGRHPMNDLRFDAAQTREVVSLAGLDDRAAEALFERTDGWPAGLKLAVSALTGAPSAALSRTASHRATAT